MLQLLSLHALVHFTLENVDDRVGRDSCTLKALSRRAAIVFMEVFSFARSGRRWNISSVRFSCRRPRRLLHEVSSSPITSHEDTLELCLVTHSAQSIQRKRLIPPCLSHTKNTRGRSGPVVVPIAIGIGRGNAQPKAAQFLPVISTK